VREGALYVRNLRIEAAGLGPLPLYGATADGRARLRGAEELILRGLRGEDVLLGPYPAPEVRITYVRSDGSTR
jgi:hypothetical protein